MTSLRRFAQSRGSSDERFDGPDDQPVRGRFGIGTGDGLGLGTVVSPHSAGAARSKRGLDAIAGVEVEARGASEEGA